MPYSVYEGKEYVAGYFADLRCERILDIGAGSGIWRDVIGPVQPGAHWTAVEVWGPYVGEFGLEARYDRVIVGDARYLDWAKLGTFDLVLFGDVLEHMPPDDAAALLGAALAASAYVVVSMPIVHYPQGPEFGNPYETHVAHYDPATARALFGERVVGESLGEIVGTFILQSSLAGDGAFE